MTLSAQVGVNNSSPEQTLDVNGKVKIGNDGATPSDGTLRYNSSEESFEGYAGGEWQSLNKAASGQNVRALSFHEAIVSVAGGTGTTNFTLIRNTIDSETGGFINSGNNPYVTPTGKLIAIDRITVIASDGVPDEFFYVGVAPASYNAQTNEISSIRNPRIYVSGSSSTGPAIHMANHAPLFVLRPGQVLSINNTPSSQTRVRVVVHGFEVDSLEDYYGL
ncbi:hypothetical protein A3850_004435 [Lewinella sp. 4G2]|nr:hypothetical protein A3850_004435 [Lewinella sp. 4G2]